MFEIQIDRDPKVTGSDDAKVTRFDVYLPGSEDDPDHGHTGVCAQEMLRRAVPDLVDVFSEGVDLERRLAGHPEALSVALSLISEAQSRLVGNAA